MNNSSRFRFALYSCLALALTLPVQAQTPSGPHPALPVVQVPGALGVNIHFTDAKPGEMEMLREGGFRVIRMDFAWSGTEKVKGQYDFSDYDRLMKSLDANKLQALFILDYSNPLYDEGLSPYTEEGRTAFAKWAAAAAVHFKGHKVLWEMYNEPNISFWRPKPDVEAYIKLALATGQAIRRAAPGECYIGAGVSGIDFRFLEACFKGGLLDYWSAVSVHPYRQSDPESAGPEYQRLRLMIERYKPKGKTIPILSGEWGFSSAWPNFNDERQGKYLPREWMTNLMNGIPVSIWYDWHDDGTDPKEPEHHFGTAENEYFEGRTPVYNPKPSYIAARTLSQFLNGLKFNKRLALESGSDFVLLFSTDLPRTGAQGIAQGSVNKLAIWTTGEPHDVVIPVSSGSFKVVNYLGEAQPEVTATAQGLKVRVSDTPLYLEPTKSNEALRQIANLPILPLEELVVAPSKPRSDRNAPVMKRDSLPTEMRVITPVASLPVTQAVQAVVANPLYIGIEPSAQNTLVARLENPFGARTAGQVTLNGANAQAVDFADEQKTLTFPLPALQADGSWEARLRFSGKAPDDVIETSYRFVPLKAFANLTGDNLTESLVARPDGDAAVESEQKLSIENAPEAAPNGGPVVKLAYRFAPGWKFANIQPLNTTWATIEGSPKRLGMWVYGDNSGQLLRMRFSDSTGQTFQPAGGPINWNGWRYYSFPLDNSGGHWGGANDGQIHGALKVESLFLLDSAESKGGQGEIYVSSPSWIY